MRVQTHDGADANPNSNILSSPLLYRFGVVCDLVNQAGFILLMWRSAFEKRQLEAWRWEFSRCAAAPVEDKASDGSVPRSSC